MRDGVVIRLGARRVQSWCSGGPGTVCVLRFPVLHGPLKPFIRAVDYIAVFIPTEALWCNEVLYVN